MLDSQSFTPVETITVSASTTTAAGAFSTGAGIAANAMVIKNPTTAVAFVRWGSSAQTAVATDYPVLAGEQAYVPKGISIANVAVILSTGTGNIYFTAGNG